MTSENGMSPADYAAISGNDGFGNGNGAWWLILLFLVFGNNWGGYGNGGTGAEMQRGFDQAALTGQINDLQNTLYTNQIASMNQNFANQQALDNRLCSMEMGFQNCCCENRAGLADLKYTVATEACADRSAVNDALRNVIENQTANTQRILDTMCQDKIDAKNEKIQALENQINMLNLQASQNAQTATLLADNTKQTTAVEQYLNPTAIPAYIVQNPNCCQQNFGTCGCGM